ncbi:MAG: pesticin C-terminus-like muramidase [Proteobacteria bacterium]|nr:pesticin C-terminus-like muramidase [Pseudomonadota bacterium]
MRSAIKQLEERWQAGDPYCNFEQVGCIRQTVVASVAFQYGDLESRTPNYWQQVTTGDWPAALYNLRNFGDRYPTRRNKEADLLESWLHA